jgi:hypothetical protein
MSTASPELRDLVREDPGLTPQEKETTIRFAKDEERATVFTAEAGLTRRLLAHPETDTVGVVVADGDARREVDTDDVRGRSVVACRVRLPVGALTVSLHARDAAGHAEVVTDRALYAGGEGE